MYLNEAKEILKNSGYELTESYNTNTKTIREVMNEYEGEYVAVEVFEAKNRKLSFHTDQINALDDSMYNSDDIVVDYELMDKDDYDSTISVNSSVSFEDVYEKDDKVLVILVQPEVELTYIHVSAPAPRYAIKSISSLFLAVSFAASSLGYYFDEEKDANNITGDIILDPAYGEDEALEVLKEAADYMENEKDYTGVELNGNTLTYDSAKATIVVSEPTRNY